MREILFRGKRKDGKWVYGGFCCVEKMNKTGDEQFIIEYPADGAEYPVELNTVSQFTGLTDKNGKKIFEGDIVRDEYNGGIARIAFLQQGCGWYLVFKNTDRRMGHRSRNSAYDNDLELEVIGNIHDNPELMEVNNGA